MATPLLVHFKFDVSGARTNEEEDVSAEIRAWFQDYERKLRNEGRNEGARGVLVHQLNVRFGELPPSAIARLKTASVNDIERWSERVLRAQTLAEVFDDAS